jgi:hypothetical protein
LSTHLTPREILGIDTIICFVFGAATVFLQINNHYGGDVEGGGAVAVIYYMSMSQHDRPLGSIA